MIQSIETVLEKHSKSLASLTFEIDSFSSAPVHLPIFPVLKNFEVVHSAFWYGYRNEEKDPASRFIFRSNSNRVLYREHFPVLESLNILNVIEPLECERCEGFEKFWRFLNSYFDQFFPLHGEQVCKTLRCLDILYCWRRKGQNLKGLYPERMQEIERLFPNVKNRWIN
jgi:hypothetical protein